MSEMPPNGQNGQEGNRSGASIRTDAVNASKGDAPALEVILDEAPAHLQKRHDPESGLVLIDI
jgi:hypothetical protein